MRKICRKKPQTKYLNNIVEQDHRFIKKITNPMLGFKSFQTPEETLAGIEAFHILRKKPKIEMAFLIFVTQTILLLVVRFFWFPDIIKCKIYFSLAAH
jgi:transposase-like protein